jgi:hypothetical protein
MVSSILSLCSSLSEYVVYPEQTKPPSNSLSDLSNKHIIMNNMGLVFNMKYQSLFNTWGYRSDVGDSANSFGKPRSC